MTWFAMVDTAEIALNERGLGQSRRHPVGWLDEGTILIDVREDDRFFTRTLLRCGELRLDRTGQDTLDIIIGGHARQTITLGAVAQGAHLMAYTWSHAEQRAWLTLTRPGDTRAEFHKVLPFETRHFDDIHRAVTAPDLHLDETVSFLAVSDRIERLFPLPGLTAQTPVMTPFGARPVHALKRGDLVRLADGQDVPVLMNIAATVPARGALAPVSAGLSCFGLQPAFSGAPYQGIALSGSYVEYTLSREMVEAPLTHLASYQPATKAGQTPVITYYGPVLPQVSPIVSGRAQLMSFNIGRLRRKPELLQRSLLAHVPRRDLPEHATPPRLRLSPAEARAFVHGQVA